MENMKEQQQQSKHTPTNSAAYCTTNQWSQSRVLLLHWRPELDTDYSVF